MKSKLLFLSSPAKRLDFETEWSSDHAKQPIFSSEAEVIAKILKEYSIDQLAKKLHISQKLAQLNYFRYQAWDKNDHQKLKPAILAYQGDVYKSLDVDSLKNKELDYLQDNFRIISGMYGLLKPYDLVQAYRLEMKIKLGESNINSLYDYWSEKITNNLNNQIKDGNHQFCINLSSQEYSKTINQLSLNKPLINIKFTQMRNGTVKSIGILNKRARGLMLRYAAQMNVKNIDELSLFNVDAYKLESRNELELVFLK